MQHHKVFTGALTAPADIPRRASHKVSLKAVPCPDCKAEVGDSCLSTNGLVVNNGHRARRVRAHRAAEAWRFVEPAPEPECPEGRLPCPVCGKHVTTRGGHRNFGEDPSATYYRRHRDGDYSCPGGERTVA